MSVTQNGKNVPAGATLLRRRPALAWVVLATAAAFLGLGLILSAWPEAGAWIFGIPTREPVALSYVRALGFRDIALALYLAALTVLATPKGLALVLGLSVLMPVCDVVLVAAVSGFVPLHLGLHAAGGALLGTLAFLVGRTWNEAG